MWEDSPDDYDDECRRDHMEDDWIMQETEEVE